MGMDDLPAEGEGVRVFDRQGKQITMREWSHLLENSDYKIIRQSHIDDMMVSTVWLGLDHAFHIGNGPHAPIIFETMIFGGMLDQEYQQRYATEEQAIEGHEIAVQWVKNLQEIQAL